jgi:hypothetical protein
MKPEKYFVTKEGTIVNEYNIKMAALIVHNMHLDTDEQLYAYINDHTEGILFESSSPTIEDFLKNYQYVAAIRFYYNAHRDEGMLLQDARKYVNSVREKMIKAGELH